MIGNLIRIRVGFENGRNCARLCLIYFAALATMLAAVTASASTYYVNVGQADDTGDGLSWPTAMKAIQTAIDSSAAGDTILVKHGTYTITTALLLDSDRKITSDDGGNGSWDSATYDESLCTIEASATSRVLTISGTGATGETRIRGFKIAGGRATTESPGNKYGGGIYIAGGADPVIEYCRITGNTASTSGTGYGGGIACNGGGTEPVIEHNWIEYNTASTSWYGYGGGVYCNLLTMCEIASNFILNNTASTARVGFGGGIYASQSRVNITTNDVSANVAAGPGAYGGSGGGIYVYRGNVEIFGGWVNNNHAAEGNGRTGWGGGIFTSGSGDISIDGIVWFLGNVASTNGPGYGGGIFCGSGITTISNNAIWENVAAGGDAAGYGGGIYLGTYDGNLVRDNEIWANTASDSGLGRGGGIYTNTSSEIDHNTIVCNIASDKAEGYGGACWFGNSGGTVFTNNTVFHNANTDGPFGSGAGSGLYHDSGSGLTIVNNIISGHAVEYSDSVGTHFSLPTTIRYNCFHDNPGGDYNANVTSTDEVLADPRLGTPICNFVAYYDLNYDSPCIEAGDPTFSYNRQAWIKDIGAVEYRGERHWLPVTGTGELLFGGVVKAKVNVTTLGTLSEIDMVVHRNERHPQAPVSVKRWYEIDHVGEGMAFDLTLTYDHYVLGDHVEATLAMWRWTGSEWEGPKATSVDTLENTATVYGQTEFGDWILADTRGPTAVGEAQGRFQLFASYPNPFNPSTTIAYELAAPAHVDLAIYNAAGQLVKVLVNSDRSVGYHEVRWEGRDLGDSQVASGVYFCRIKAAGEVQTIKLVQLK